MVSGGGGGVKHLWGKLLGGALLGGSGFALGWELWDNSVSKPKSGLGARKVTKQEFIALVKAALTSAFGVTGAPLAAAWAAFESSWGRQGTFKDTFNLWNVTAGSLWTGATVPGPDTEYDASGKVKNISQSWRKYGSVQEAASDMVGFLTVDNPKLSATINQARHDAFDALKKGDVGTFVRKLYEGKYFTLPPDKYLAGVNADLTDVQALWSAPNVA